jgi:hypothetical protein
MVDKTQPGKSGTQSLGAWQKPRLQRVGDVGDVFKMPGGGKLSLTADDSGDSDRKPKGQE